MLNQFCPSKYVPCRCLETCCKMCCIILSFCSYISQLPWCNVWFKRVYLTCPADFSSRIHYITVCSLSCCVWMWGTLQSCGLVWREYIFLHWTWSIRNYTVMDGWAPGFMFPLIYINGRYIQTKHVACICIMVWWCFASRWLWKDPITSVNS